MAPKLLTDIVIESFNHMIELLKDEKAQLERTYLSKPAEELASLNKSLQEKIEQFGVHSIQAQQFLYDNIKSFTDIQRRIKAHPSRVR